MQSESETATASAKASANGSPFLLPMARCSRGSRCSPRLQMMVLASDADAMETAPRATTTATVTPVRKKTRRHYRHQKQTAWRISNSMRLGSWNDLHRCCLYLHCLMRRRLMTERCQSPLTEMVRFQRNDHRPKDTDSHSRRSTLPKQNHLKHSNSNLHISKPCPGVRVASR